MASGTMTIPGVFGITGTPEEAQESAPTVEVLAVEVLPETLSAPSYKSLVVDMTPNASLQFWEKLAVCETNSNWQDKGTWAGGLGIYTRGKFPQSGMGTWERFGGEEFAPSPNKATKEQQIIVADRISVEGWKTTVDRGADKARRMGVPQIYEWDQKPVGFGGWGCYKSKSTGKYRMAKPKLFHYDPAMVPIVQYYWNQKGLIVQDLQKLIGATVDGRYGAKTKAAHVKYLKKHKLSLIGVGRLSKSESESAKASSLFTPLK